MDVFVNTALVRSALRELASEQEQRRLWLSDGAAGREVSSFVETRCQLFDDSGLGLEMERKQVVFGEPVDTMFKRLDTMLLRINSDRAPDQIIADPRMEEVRSLAADLMSLDLIL